MLFKVLFAHLQIGIWAPKHLISQAKYAIEVTPKIMDYYEKFFQIDFPLPKQGKNPKNKTPFYTLGKPVPNSIKFRFFAGLFYQNSAVPQPNCIGKKRFQGPNGPYNEKIKNKNILTNCLCQEKICYFATRLIWRYFQRNVLSWWIFAKNTIELLNLGYQK